LNGNTRTEREQMSSQIVRTGKADGAQPIVALHDRMEHDQRRRNAIAVSLRDRPPVDGHIIGGFDLFGQPHWMGSSSAGSGDLVGSDGPAGSVCGLTIAGFSSFGEKPVESTA
jgi:hypothetical protein